MTNATEKQVAYIEKLFDGTSGNDRLEAIRRFNAITGKDFDSETVANLTKEQAGEVINALMHIKRPSQKQVDYAKKLVVGVFGDAVPQGHPFNSINKLSAHQVTNIINFLKGYSSLRQSFSTKPLNVDVTLVGNADESDIADEVSYNDAPIPDSYADDMVNAYGID